MHNESETKALKLQQGLPFFKHLKLYELSLFVHVRFPHDLKLATIDVELNIEYSDNSEMKRLKYVCQNLM